MLKMLSLQLVVQLLINGILFGAVYGIAAVGLSLIFGTMRIIFLAQGTIIVLFAYMCFWLFTLLGIDPYLSLVLVIATGVLLGAAIYRGLFTEAAANEDKNISLLIAIGIMFFLENLMTIMWTGNPRSITTTYTSFVVRFAGIGIPFTKFTGFVMAVAAAAAVALFLKKTLIGTAVRAASEDIVSATLMGINPHRVNAVAFAAGIGLAGVAGVDMATIYPFDPFYGFDFVLKGLIALAIGGIGSVSGALLGGVILGLLESLSSFFVPGGWTDAICYGVFLIVLMWRPQGLLARSAGKA
jgi:branched-chain amino acid transport system permease protein